MAQDLPEEVLEEFRTVGSWLDRRGLNTSHSGNLSRRHEGRIYITRSGAMLGDLSPDDLIQIVPPSPGPGHAAPSVETPVHLAVYSSSDHNAIIHAHPPYTVAMSFLLPDLMVPPDVEGRAVLGTVPVLQLKDPAGSPEAADAVSKALEDARAVVIAGHGVFAAGSDLKEALHYVSSLEFSSTLLYLTSFRRVRP